MTEVIVLDDVAVALGGRDVVAGASARVATGELVAIVGPNGAGKTTLLRVIAGLLAPSRGRVRTFGQDPRAADRRRLARQLAYVPQRYELAFPFTALEVVLIGRYPYRRGPGLDGADDLAVDTVHAVARRVGVNCVDGEVELRSVTIRQNDDKGIDASSCVVAVSRSTITSNAGGGILLVNSGFDITNNIIHTNQTITFGGVYIQNISTTTATPRRLEFNTIANNNGAAASGVSCQFVSDPLVFHSNIIFANDSATDTENLSGALCTHEYSAIEAAGAGTTGTGVVTTNPMFVNEGGGNFLLAGGSPMRELASPSATMTIDYQGEPRPQPATGARNDIGADEIP